MDSDVKTVWPISLNCFKDKEKCFSTHKCALCFVHCVHWGIHSKELLFLVVHNTNCQDKKESCHDKEWKLVLWLWEKHFGSQKTSGAMVTRNCLDRNHWGRIGRNFWGDWRCQNKKLWDWRKWDRAFGNEAAWQGSLDPAQLWQNLGGWDGIGRNLCGRVLQESSIIAWKISKLL